MYEIKPFQEAYIGDQYRIGASIYNLWPMGGQTKIKELKESYSKEDFDPETRLYAFINDEMVGFITTKLLENNEAYFEWPYVLRDHRIAEELLINRAIDVLKAKGVTKLITRAGNYWGRTRDLAEHYRFTYDRDIVSSGLFKISVIKYTDHSKVVVYSNQFEGLLKDYLKMRINDDSQIDQIIAFNNNIRIGEEKLNPWDIPYSIEANIIYIDEEIRGQLILMHNRNFGERRLIITTLQATSDDVRLALLSKARELLENDYEEVIIHIGPWGLQEQPGFWNDLGVEFYRQLAYYTKILD
ncbi:MAG: hypothetical protein INQ03_18200 [Candidatus Heimdallarchaeota archaeon]|nr:hypothetical protein [Candidatus Heimdallarchaeota archaeon]